MNNLIVGPDFELTGYYAQALKTIFVTLFYSSGIPMMLVFGSISLFLQYLCNKYILLRFSRKPPTFDQNLHEKTMKVLPMAVLLHLLVAIYIYGYPLIFPYSGATITILSNSISAGSMTTISTSTDFVSIIKNRVEKTPWLSVVALFIVIYYILSLPFFRPISLAL